MATLKIKTEYIEIEYTDECNWLTKDSTDRIIDVLKEIGKPMTIVGTKEGKPTMSWEEALNTQLHTGKPK